MSFWIFQEYLQGNQNYGILTANLIISVTPSESSKVTPAPTSSPASAPSSLLQTTTTAPSTLTTTYTPSLSPAQSVTLAPSIATLAQHSCVGSCGTYVRSMSNTCW